MAEKISIGIELKSKLDELSKLDTSQLKLSQKQRDALAINKKGAETALKNNDFKEFRRYFNQFADIIKKASVASGKISQNLQDLTKRQEEINKKIQALQEKRDKLEGSITSSKGKNTLSKEQAKNLLSGFKDRDKIIGKGKDSLTDPSVINQRIQKLAAELERTGKTWSNLSNDLAQKFDFRDKNAAHAAHRFYDSEQKYITTTQGQIADIDTEIGVQKNEATSVAEEIKKIEETSPDAAEALQQLYAAISKLKEETNTEITTAQSEKSKKEASLQSGADIDTKPLTEGINKQSSALGKAFKQFTLYAIAVRAAKTALREAVQTVKELDKYLTEQAMVTGLTREQTYGLVKEYQNLALQCGATTKEIASVATEYMKQGKTVQESLTLTKAAVSAAKVARVSVSDSVNYLTTALNGFRLSAEDAMRVSDKFAAVAASSATDYDELAIALSKVASQANLAGMSIDYTTALLTKGLETTREAPETMGTALKTIIARMRELSDYGETLEGDTDINNVESQLAYVGIALRDTNGELRSTEDVLDELGKKWDSLNKNQQAALAKALAGTRQQSRLIALMDDYERVTELQEISQRSAGATAAQAGVYLEGIEASMNKIQVAWEKIIMTLTDSEIIIDMFSFIGDSLDRIGDFLSTDFGIIAILTTISLIGLNIVGNKIIENNLAKEQLAIKQKENIEELKNLKTQQLEKLTKSENAKIAAAALKVTTAEGKLKTAITKQELLQQKIRNGIKVSYKEIQAANYEVLTATNEVKAAEKELNIAIKENGEEGLDYLDTQRKINSETATLGGIFGGLTGALYGIVGVLGIAFNIFQMIAMVSGIIVKLKDEEYRKTIRNTIADKAQAAVAKIKAAFGMADSASKIPYVGWVIAAGILATLVGIAIATAVTSANKYEKSAKGTAESVNKLSNEIYKLNSKANEINNITTAFDKLDNKLIKTNSDLKEMSSLLDQAADKLDTEVDKKHDWYGGKSEKEYYESFSSHAGKRKALELIESNNRKLANEKRTEQINKVKGLSGKELARFLDDEATDAEILQAQDAIYALNNNELYEYIDLQKESGKLTEEQATAVESLTQSILEGMSAEEAWAYAKDDDGKKVQALARSLQELTMVVKDVNGKMVTLNVGSILNSDDYSLKDQVEAFEKTRNALLKEYGSASEEFKAFSETFSQYEFFTQLEEDALDFVDSVGMSINELNDLYGAWEKLKKRGVNISQEEWEGNFELYLETLAATQGDVLAATELIFGEYLDDSEDALNAFIEAYGDLVQVGILNMGQNIDKVKNSINNFYEKALEWDKMSESDKAEFIQDNAELFSDGNLLQAFESGNYEDIEKALSKNEAFQKQLEQRRKEIAQELLIEEARTGEARNEAYIAQLKAYQEYLNDTENLFKASLEVRLEQEQAQLDEYRSYLEDQQEALEESLNKRKEAYEKYFDEINKEEEDEDYENQAELLISNISKLGSTTNASAQKQTKELEQQLKELEKERLKELRERAQEAVMENMDNTLEEISDKFDKLLESNQALLAVMKGDLNNPVDFISDLISNKIESGATALEVQDYIGNLQSTYGSVLGNNVEWDAIQVREENNQLFLNVNGHDVPLDTNNEQNLYQAIMKALREVGLR